MTTLLEKIRKAREKQVEIDGFSFTIRRPTDYEIAQYSERDPLDLVKQFVVDWTLKEIDLVPGGNPERVAFDADLLAEWGSDHLTVIVSLLNEIKQAYADFVEQREQALGEPKAG